MTHANLSGWRRTIELRIYAALVFLLWSGAFVSRAADYYVRPPETCTNTTLQSPYTNWDTAATQIQWAVNVAMANLPATVWVTNGAYCVTNQITITNSITLRSVNGYSNTLVYSDWPNYTTRCFYVANTGIVDGFTISNGHCYSTSDNNGGAGVYAKSQSQVKNCYILNNVYYNSAGPVSDNAGGCGAYLIYSAIISNCLVYSNISLSASAKRGGGIFLQSDSQALNCRVISNTAEYGGGIAMRSGVNIVSNCFVAYNSRGGGIENTGTGGLITDCVVSNNNNYVESGGGIYMLNGNINNCTIVGNYDNCSYGGGIYGGTVSNCSVINNRMKRDPSDGAKGGGIYGGSVYNSRIIGNSAPYGGGVYSSTLRNCMVISNLASGDWGGVGDGGGAAGSTLYDCLLAGNQAAKSGGGVSNCTLYSCTLVGNLAANGGGTVTSRLYNSIVYFNQATTSGSNWNNIICFTNCCTMPTNDLPGSGNIANDPEFIANGAGYGTNHVPGNYRLSGRSPCINAGINQNWMTNAFDLGGDIRIRYVIVDMGAYEKLFRGTIVGVR